MGGANKGADSRRRRGTAHVDKYDVARVTRACEESRVPPSRTLDHAQIRLVVRRSGQPGLGDSGQRDGAVLGTGDNLTTELMEREDTACMRHAIRKLLCRRGSSGDVEGDAVHIPQLHAAVLATRRGRGVRMGAEGGYGNHAHCRNGSGQSKGWARSSQAAASELVAAL